MISGRFLSFLEAQGLICKMGIERPLPPRTVHRVTFINNHTVDHAEKESILGFEYHEAVLGAITLSHSPFAGSQAPHAPAATGGPDQQVHLARRGLGPVAAPAVVFWTHHQGSPSVDPLGFTLTAFAVSTQLTFISPGPPRQVLYLEA